MEIILNCIAGAHIKYPEFGIVGGYQLRLIDRRLIITDYCGQNAHELTVRDLTKYPELYEYTLEALYLKLKEK